MLPTKYDTEVLGVSAGADADTIRAGNFGGLVKRRLREAVPSATSRSDKRALYKLVSDGAALGMRQAAMTDPSLLGKTVSTELLASDDVDLWIKGYDDRLEDLPSSGTATPIVKGDEVEIVVESNAFQTILLTIKQALRDAAARLERQARNQGRGVTVYEGRLKASWPE